MTKHKNSNQSKKRARYHRKTKGESGGTGEESIVIGMFDRSSGKRIAEALPDGEGETLRDWFSSTLRPAVLSLRMATADTSLLRVWG